MSRSFLVIALSVLPLLGMSACGGGGGGSSPPPIVIDPPPVADTDLDWDEGNWDEENWQ